MSCSGSWDCFGDVKVTFADGFRQLSDITEKCDYRVPTLRIVGGYNKSRGSGNTCLCPDTQKQGDPSLPVAVLLPELKKKKKPSVLFVSFQSCRRLPMWISCNPHFVSSLLSVGSFVGPLSSAMHLSLCCNSSKRSGCSCGPVFLVLSASPRLFSGYRWDLLCSDSVTGFYSAAPQDCIFLEQILSATSDNLQFPSTLHWDPRITKS